MCFEVSIFRHSFLGNRGRCKTRNRDNFIFGRVQRNPVLFGTEECNPEYMVGKDINIVVIVTYLRSKGEEKEEGNSQFH